ncbi:MAG: hypothetical protein ACD_46C00099G0001, partial [uncultured bacterium]
MMMNNSFLQLTRISVKKTCHSR